MRILMTADSLGGVWPYACDLGHGLSRHGAEVILAVLGPPPSPKQRDAALGLSLVAFDLPLDWTASSPSDVCRAGEHLAGYAEESEADIVLLHSAAFAARARFAMPVVVTCHSCVATWWEACGEGPLPEDLRWRRDLVESGLHNADAIVAPSDSFAAEITRTYRLPASPLVVRNGRRESRGPSVGRSPGEAPMLFTAGRLWDRAKNIALLDRIAPLLPHALVAAGSTVGPNGESISLPNLRLAGCLDADDIAAYLSGRPVFLSFARYEPFGLAVLEAAQAGCPLVLADHPTFRELWADAALLVDHRDEDAIVASIHGLAADAALRAEFGERARMRAARYTEQAMTDGMLAIFKRLACRRPGYALDQRRVAR